MTTKNPATMRKNELLTPPDDGLDSCAGNDKGGLRPPKTIPKLRAKS